MTTTRTNLAEYRKNGGEPHSMANQRILSKLVDREVIYCVSSLVDHFAKNENALDGSDYTSDDVYGLFQRRYDHTDTIQELRDAIEVEEAWLDDECYDQETVASKIASLERDIEKLENEQENPDEVYEHWVVSNWFAEKLAEHGETTGELFGLTIWGRCTTGQSISLDGVIAEIAAEMGILEGQPSSWAE